MINTESIRDAAEVLDTLTSNLPADHPFRAEAEGRAKKCVGRIYAAADEVDRLRAAMEQIRHNTYLRSAIAIAEVALDGKHWTDKT